MTTYSREAIENILNVYKTLTALWKVKRTEYKDKQKRNAQYSILPEVLTEKGNEKAESAARKAEIEAKKAEKRKDKMKILQEVELSLIHISEPTRPY